MTGAQLVYDHHHIQSTFNDHYIHYQWYRLLKEKKLLNKKNNISIQVFHNIVVLTGEIPSVIDKIRMDILINHMKKIKKQQRIYNFTENRPVLSNIEEMNDTWITTKIKSQLIFDKEIDPSHIKVFTTHGTVYLMGIVDLRTANIAIYIAAHTEHVKHVIKIFDYIKIIRQPASPLL